MSDDMSNIINNIKNMMDNGNLPDNLQEMVNNFKNNENTNNVQNQNTNQQNSNSTSTTNFDTNTISPEMIQNLSNLFSSNSNDNNTNSSNNNNSNSEPSIDINTILKMKTIIDSMNQKNDPRANLLYSLKPYLRENKKNKLDQYVNLLKMTKIADIMKTEKKENNKNA